MNTLPYGPMVAAAAVAMAGIGCTTSATRQFEDPVTNVRVRVSVTGWPEGVGIQADLTDPSHQASFAGLVLRGPDGRALTPNRLRVMMPERRITDQMGSRFGYGRDRGDVVARRRGGWDPPGDAPGGGGGGYTRRSTRSLSDGVLVNRARTTPGIDHVEAYLPVAGSTRTLSGYAVGLVMFVGPQRQGLGVVLPLDPARAARRVNREVVSPMQLALEMELAYVPDLPARPGRPPSTAEPAGGGSD